MNFFSFIRFLFQIDLLQSVSKRIHNSDSKTKPVGFILRGVGIRIIEGDRVHLLLFGLLLFQRFIPIQMSWWRAFFRLYKINVKRKFISLPETGDFPFSKEATDVEDSSDVSIVDLRLEPDRAFNKSTILKLEQQRKTAKTKEFRWKVFFKVWVGIAHTPYAILWL